jgi:hypothetical protein
MSAGYIQLAAIGQQDAYLTGEPQVTYFAGVYKRHTPFVLEAYDIPFENQSVVYGQQNICRIPPKGDLIRALTLKVTLPALFDPGSFWAWTTTASATNDPHIIINGTYFALPIQGITYYSTYNQSSWISTQLANFFSYSSAANQFIFSNCSTLEVEQNGGIFWGLDPRLGTLTKTSNLVYTVGTFSNGTSNSSSNIYSNAYNGQTKASDFSLQQAGWIQSTGLPQVNTRTSIFLSLNQNYIISSSAQNFINFFNWTNQDTVSTYSVTTNGRLKFTNPGFYMVRAGFSLGTGSILNVSYGSDPNESLYPIGIPTVPQFAYSCDFRVSPDPSMPLLMPLVVASTANTYYFYANTTSTVTQLTSGTYLTVSPVDDLYMFNTSISVPAAKSNIVPFYNNIVTPQNSTVTLGSDNSITFGSAGTWMLSGVVYLTQPASGPGNYVSNVLVWHGAGIVDYSYNTLSTQGRDPTIAFSMPIVVTSTSQKYYTNIYCSSATNILTQSYYVINQIGAQTYTGYETVLSNNGLLFTPPAGDAYPTQKTGPNTPLKFNGNGSQAAFSNVSSSLVSSIISVNQATGNLQFSNIATYMLTAVISTADNVKSISFGTTTYNFDIAGLFPQYTVTVPYRVTQINTDVPITITTDQVGTTTSIFSNTYISVYPVASNVIPTLSYNYYDSVGTWLVNRADLVIGGQTVQTLTGEFIEIYNDLYVPYENQPGLKLLTGKYDTGSQIYPPGRTYFVNLPFYFYQNPGLALPISALGRQDVEIHITFRNLQELTPVKITPSISSQTLTATIITEYVYLADPEINWFKNSQVDYIIQQCQYQTFELPSQFTSAVLKLDFINPIRELFFILQLDGTIPYIYSDLNSLAMNFNASEAFTADVTDSLYLNSIEPFNHYTNYPTRLFYMYAFTKQTNTPRPYGQVNFSRIRDIFIRLNTNSYVGTKQFRVIGINYNVLRVKNGIAGLMFNSGDY